MHEPLHNIISHQDKNSLDYREKALMEKLNSKAMHKFSFWYYGKSVFSTFFTNFPALAGYSLILLHTSLPPGRSQSLGTRSLSVSCHPGRIVKESGLLVKLMAVSHECVESCTSWVDLWVRAFWFEGWDFPKGHRRLDFPKALPIRNRFLQTGPFGARTCINSLINQDAAGPWEKVW